MYMFSICVLGYWADFLLVDCSYFKSSIIVTATSKCGGKAISVIVLMNMCYQGYNASVIGMTTNSQHLIFWNDIGVFSELHNEV